MQGFLLETSIDPLIPKAVNSAVRAFVLLKTSRCCGALYKDSAAICCWQPAYSFSSLSVPNVRVTPSVQQKWLKEAGVQAVLVCGSEILKKMWREMTRHYAKAFSLEILYKLARKDFCVAAKGHGEPLAEYMDGGECDQSAPANRRKFFRKCMTTAITCDRCLKEFQL
jgi:hypothetical protein